MAAASDLLARHLPVLRYDSQGSFLADSPGVMTDRPGNLLRAGEGRTRAGGPDGPALDLCYLGWPTYRDDAKAARSDHLDAVGRDYVAQARVMHRNGYADHIHGRAAPADDGGWWLQYWFFYLYNNKSFLGFGLHEGDWEMVQVRLDPRGRPLAMTFAQHGHGQRCEWATVERRGERPVVYVARGSQASYAFRGRHDAPVVPDYADGKGAEVADATLVVIERGRPEWVDWPGRWGSSRARTVAESNSPRGPAHQEKWAHPATFHAESDEVQRTRERVTPGPAPPTPEIVVRREGDRAVIGYRLPAAPGRTRPVALVVSVDDPGDALPPATEGHAIDVGAGELQHGLPLGEGPYEVRVSAADEHGNASSVAVARLP